MNALPWIKLWSELPEHPKADRLERMLGRARAWTHVVELWLWAARQHGDGNLAGVDDATIARRSGWRGNPAKFVAALREAGFLDADGRLHDWGDHQAAHVAVAEGAPIAAAEDKATRRRRLDRERKAKRNEAERHAESSASRAERAAEIPQPSAENSASHAEQTPVSARAETKTEKETETKSVKDSFASSDSTRETTPPPTAPEPPARAKPTRARRSAAPADPQLAPDQAAYLARFRELFRSPSADFTRGGVFEYRRLRAKYGAPTLLRSLDGLAGDDFRRRTWSLTKACSQEGVDIGTREQVASPNAPATRLVNDAWAEKRAAAACAPPLPSTDDLFHGPEAA